MKLTSVKFGKRQFKLKTLTPLDFIEDSYIPFTLFTLKENTTVYQETFKIKTKEEQLASLKHSRDIITQVLDKGVVSPRIKARVMVDKDFNLAFFLYSALIQISTPNLKKIYSLKREFILATDELCKRYGQRPAQILLPDGSLLEKLLIDTFILTIGLEQDLINARRLKNG